MEFASCYVLEARPCSLRGGVVQCTADVVTRQRKAAAAAAAAAAAGSAAGFATTWCAHM
jgi:hypothetical protein